MKKICVVSGTRADYGLLYWTMKTIQENHKLKLLTVATCMHLDEKFGNTWKYFEKDSIPLSKKISLGSISDSTQSVVDQVSQGIAHFFSYFKKESPDAVIILGDRYEMLAASQAAFFMKVPIIHIAGGEVTEGAIDDSIRNVITKLSSYHFTTTEKYRERVIQMGEHPNRVVCIGAPGLESIDNLKLLTRNELIEEFTLLDKIALITYHPVTAIEESHLDQLIKNLSLFPDITQIITLPNSDPGHSEIIDSFTKYQKQNKNVILTKSLGSLRYLSLMKQANIVIGNSSSAIVEAPYIGTYSINIGTRQTGRIHDKSVINSDDGNIAPMIKKLITDPPPKRSMLHGDGNFSNQLIKFIETNKLTNKVGFYDL